jgi:hypothetical protein
LNPLQPPPDVPWYQLTDATGAPITYNVHTYNVQTPLNTGTPFMPNIYSAQVPAHIDLTAVIKAVDVGKDNIRDAERWRYFREHMSDTALWAQFKTPDQLDEYASKNVAWDREQKKGQFAAGGDK